jgi:hypothetical protein
LINNNIKNKKQSYIYLSILIHNKKSLVYVVQNYSPQFFSKQFLLIICIVIIGIISCTKMDVLKKGEKPTDESLTNRFFTEHRTADPTETKLVNFVKRKYANENIADKIIKIVGLPRWNKISVYKDNNASIVTTAGSTTTFYVPLVIDSQNYVNAAMAIQASATDTTLTYLQDWKYKNLQNNTNSYSDSAENYAVFFMRQTRNVFENNTFKILDSNLFRFNNRKVDSVTLAQETSQSSNLQTIETTCLNATIILPCDIDGGFVNSLNSNNSNSTPIRCGISWTYCTTDVSSAGAGSGAGGVGTSAPSNPPSGSGSSNTPGGGYGWTPVLTGINYLIPALELTTAQITFLNQPGNQFLIHQLYQYNSVSASADKKEISKEFITELMASPSYLLFCQNQSNNSDSGIVWWEDTEWLNSINYNIPPAFKEFYEYAKGTQNKKPIEFEDVCAGLEDLAISSKNSNGAEQLGYITPGTSSGATVKHFIKVASGSGSMVGTDKITIGGEMFYYYRENKGMPSLSYPSLIQTTTIKGKLFAVIPIWGETHTHHFNNGENIDIPGTLSTEDKKSAKKNAAMSLQPFYNFVIQVNDYNLYSIGEFFDEISGVPQTSYSDLHSGITLAEICSLLF